MNHDNIIKEFSTSNRINDKINYELQSINTSKRNAAINQKNNNYYNNLDQQPHVINNFNQSNTIGTFNYNTSLANN